LSGELTFIKKISGKSSLIPLIFLFLFFHAGTGMGAESENSETGYNTIKPPDVFLAVQIVEKNLELVRLSMGAPKANPLDIRVNKAAPYDAYFQALTLFQKANRLSFEIIRQREILPPLSTKAVHPCDVLRLVNGAQQSVRKVTAELNILWDDAEGIRDESKTSTDVFKIIMATNRQLNLLLERRFAPSDVYQLVTVGIGYASIQLSRLPSTTRIPDEPPFEINKKPSDVYFLLLECLDIISQMYEQADLEKLDIDSGHIDEHNITPSDVFDVASLIVARLDYLYKYFGSSRAPRKAFYPGRKFPSDVFQRTMILKAQLKQINQAFQTKGF